MEERTGLPSTDYERVVRSLVETTRNFHNLSRKPPKFRGTEFLYRTGRRSWLRGMVEVTKRYLMTVAAHNLGRILWHLFGKGKPRAMAAGS